MSEAKPGMDLSGIYRARREVMQTPAFWRHDPRLEGWDVHVQHAGDRPCWRVLFTKGDEARIGFMNYRAAAAAIEGGPETDASVAKLADEMFAAVAP